MRPTRPPKLRWPWIRVRRLVYTDRGCLIIQLGRFWEIEITRELRVDLGASTEIEEKTKGFIKRIKEFGIIPFWYGYVGRDFRRDVSMYAPVPLNYAWAFLRWLKYSILFRLKQPPRWLFKHEFMIYRLGQQDGYEKGRFNRDVMRDATEILRAKGLDARYRE